MRRLVAVLLVLASAAVASGQQETGRARVFNWRGGGQLDYSRVDSLSVTRLEKFWCQSDSMEVTADLAERRVNERRGSDEFFLRGNVVATEGATRIVGDRGHYDRNLDQATVSGNVSIDDAETVIHCDRAVYDHGAQIIHLEGHVDVLQTGSRLRAERVSYHRETGFTEAFGAVEIEDLKEGTVLRGEHGSFDRQRDIAQMDAEPVLLSTSDGDTVRVTAQRMRQLRGDSLAVAVGDVRYLRGFTEALCDSALFWQAEDRLQLYGTPRVLRKGGVLSGDTLELFFEQGEVRRMNIDGEARFRDRPAAPHVFPGKQSEIRGERFRVGFKKGEISTVEVQGEPYSLYIPPLENQGRASMNEASGDSMLLRFDAGELDEVRIFGQAHGSYRYVDDWPTALASADSAAVDSLGFYGRFQERALTIDYEAEDILYQAAAERAYLEGQAQVSNADFVLQAKAIRFDAADDFLDARGEPVLIDQGDKLYGSLMEYAIDDKVGLVHEGATRYGDGFYTGERLKKNPEDRVHAYACTYTTCDLAEPHFHFSVDRMTIQTKDKIVGAPVRFYLGDVPLFYLPYLFNDLKRGRRSGFLQPDFEFGITLNDNKPQRFIRDVGYYWATSDYMDWTVRGSFEEKKSLFGTLSTRYYRRYFMNGSVNSNFNYDARRDLVTKAFAWGLHGTHSQTFGERTTLNANVDFVSSEKLRDIDNYTVEQTVDQRLTSNVGFSHKWDNLSLNTSYRRTQILNQKDADPATDNLLLDEAVPLSLSATPIPLFPGLTARDGIAGALASLKLTPRINYSRSSKQYETRKVVTESASTGTNLGLTMKLGILTVRPGVGASENWNRSNQPVSSDVLVPFGKPADLPYGGTPLSPFGESGALAEGSEGAVDRSGEFSHRWSASTSVSTKLYGLYYPHIGRLTGVRHTFSPSASWSYEESRGKSFSLGRRVNMSLDNSLDLKFGEGDKVQRKTGVLQWSLGTAYDLTKRPEENPWSALSSSVQFNPLQSFTLSLRQSYDLNTGERQSTTLSGNLALSGRFSYGEQEKDERARNLVLQREGGAAPTDTTQAAPAADGSGFDPDAPLRDEAPAPPRGPVGEQRWNLSGSFSLNRTQTSSPSPTVNLRGRVDLTDNWSLDYQTSLSLQDGELGTQSIHVTRNLHCWEATFSRLVFQGREQYYFRIYLKAHPEDIKLESGDRSAGYGGF
ncbi:MAG: hypothetical protein H6694_07630 [Candidatus Latescibacteria bacterium]|nr:hypothetical protein [Candidatus Latescibacterota bacterium]